MSNVTPSNATAAAPAPPAQDADAEDFCDVMPASELQEKLNSVLKLVQRTKQRVVITQGGKAAAVLLDVDEYDRLFDLAERAELKAMIARAEEADATGDVVDWEDAKRDLFGCAAGQNAWIFSTS